METQFDEEDLDFIRDNFEQTLEVLHPFSALHILLTADEKKPGAKITLLWNPDKGFVRTSMEGYLDVEEPPIEGLFDWFDLEYERDVAKYKNYRVNDEKDELYRIQYFASSNKEHLESVMEDEDKITSDATAIGEFLGYPSEAVEYFVSSREIPRWKREAYEALIILLYGETSEAFVYQWGVYKPEPTIQGYKRFYEHSVEIRDFAKKLNDRLGERFFQLEPQTRKLENPVFTGLVLLSSSLGWCKSKLSD